MVGAGGKGMFMGHLRHWLPLSILCMALFVSASDAWAAKRVALLIGNEKYEATSPLNNPANDVELMKASFEEAGFDTVTTVHDVSRQDMVKALREFEDLATGAEVAIVYYSGHGMEMNGENFLLPVDVQLKTDKDVEERPSGSTGFSVRSKAPPSSSSSSSTPAATIPLSRA
ncbi:caspase family protein [Sinorhizobium sp. GL28]|uniref:caspase family protein n=1 Tax=Sinorhizobium sp. GL28 TaxID=1358418 RepID=UPI00071C2D0A|nr:caspase family protein [Sinorhizobium sp. GL28]